MIEADYFYKGLLRWNLGFASPNHAGAFVAMWLPLLWWAGEMVISRRATFPLLKRGKWAQMIFFVLIVIIFLVEGLGWWTLGKTGSRGALLAAVGALGVFTLAQRRVRDGKNGLWSIFCARVMLAALAWWLTGFGGRTAVDFLAQDASIGNRLTLWAGGLRMIAASPWHGWGGGQSGRMYEEFFQPLEHTAHYRSLVCSYLTVGAEYGLATLGAVLCVFASVGLMAWRLARGDVSDVMRGIGAACCAVLACAALANIWSNLWIVPALWWVPCMAMLLILVLVGWRKYHEQGKQEIFSNERGETSGAARGEPLVLFGLRGILSRALLLVLTILAAGWGMGSISPASVHVVRDAAGQVTLIKAGAIDGLNIAVYPDDAVLGDRAGAECRRLLSLAGVRSVSVAHTPGSDVNVVLLCGAQAALATELKHVGRILFVHPTGVPPSMTPPSGSVVVLPEFVLEPGDEVWSDWAARYQVPVRYSPRTGRDIREAWPAVLAGAL